MRIEQHFHAGNLRVVECAVRSSRNFFREKVFHILKNFSVVLFPRDREIRKRMGKRHKPVMCMNLLILAALMQQLVGPQQKIAQ